MLRKVLFAAALAACSYLMGPSLALADITCWYNDGHQFTTWTPSNGYYAPGHVERTDQGGDHSWAYTIHASDPRSCPRTRPPE